MTFPRIAGIVGTVAGSTQSGTRREPRLGIQGQKGKKQMAYMNQERKAKIKEALKQAIPSDWKWSLAVRHHSTIVLNIAAAPVNLVAEYANRRCSDEVRASMLQSMSCDVNPYHWREHFEGDLGTTFDNIFAALNDGNHDRSDLQTDYHDVGWYVDVNLGRWNKPFEVRS